MNLDTLLRDADPARDLDIPRPDPVDARQICGAVAMPAPVPHRFPGRPATAIMALAAVVVAGLVTIEIVPVSLGGSRSAAAVLRRASVATGARPTIVLRPGQFLYTEIQTLQTVTASLGPNGSMGGFSATFDVTKQTWQAADGSGRELDTYDGPPHFPSPSVEGRWAAAGRPVIESTNAPGGRLDTRRGSSTSGAASTVAGLEPGARPADDSGLPTDPDRLARVIRHGGAVGDNAQMNVQDPSTAEGTFATAVGILETPATGLSSALRSALFRVMASVPGVRLLGPATDRAGRRGIEIASPVNSRFGDRYQIIIDPATGTVLQSADVLTQPWRVPRPDRPFLGDSDTRGGVIGWTDYLGSGVVASTTAVDDGALTGTR